MGDYDTDSPADDAEVNPLDVLAAGLVAEAQEFKSYKETTEDRWLEDLSQYNGQYERQPTQKGQPKAAEGSRVTVNITRSLCRTAESRLSEMLFPTDDRNWGISPTPVPELSGAIGDPTPIIDQATGAELADAEGTVITRSGLAVQEIRKAKKAAEAMETEIDDQLVESDYPSAAREAIHDAVILGTGIIKGPVLQGRAKKSWQIAADGSGHTLQTVEDLRPGAERVDPWNWFPDPSASSVSQIEKQFERKYQSSRDIFALAQLPGYLPEQIMRLLRTDPQATHITRQPENEKKDASYDDPSGAPQQRENNLYELWEYHGPVAWDDLKACGCDFGDEEEAPLVEMMGTIIFCGGIVIKGMLHPLESEDNLYQVFNYEKDEAGLFGYGIPYRVRNAQRVINAVWRMILDNAGLSVGPQIVVNKSLVRPADGDWGLKPRKTWYLTDKNRSVQEVFGAFEISSHQQELQAIFEMARKLADEESNIPLIAQGEQGPHITKTAQGMSLLMNQANTNIRGIVKNWDDGVSVPLIQKFYDWNMQNSTREDIKGDFEVQARGSSALMVKEMQSQALFTIASNFAAHPIFGPMTNHAELYRKLVQTMRLSADDIVISDEEIAAIQEQQAAAPQSSPEEVAHRQNLEAKEFEFTLNQEGKAREFQMEIERMAQQHGLTMEQLMGNLEKDRRLMADEAEIKAQFGSGV